MGRRGKKAKAKAADELAKVEASSETEKTDASEKEKRQKGKESASPTESLKESKKLSRKESKKEKEKEKEKESEKDNEDNDGENTPSKKGKNKKQPTDSDVKHYIIDDEGPGVPWSLVFRPEVTEQQKETMDKLVEWFNASDYKNDPNLVRFCTEQTFHRYTRARNSEFDKAKEMLTQTLDWLATKKPWEFDIALMEVELRSGKFYMSTETDKYNRPVVMLDSAVQNTKPGKGQIDGLVFLLNTAISSMTDNVEKYVIFMNLSRFKLSNSPPMSQAKETLAMLQTHLPERVGAIVLYQSPWIFETLLTAVKPFVDPMTFNKIYFCNGDESEGSKNDMKMRNLMGPSWKDLTNAGKTPENGCSPGYVHQKYFPVILRHHMNYLERNKILSKEKKIALEKLHDMVSAGQLPDAPPGYLLSQYDPNAVKKKGWFW